jgi:diguanylate cyclase (GGDEF)-like protein/PAS domain S-box-containing protein
MRESAASITSRRQLPWLRRHGYGVRLATCFLSVALATGLVRAVSEANLIWVANGVLLAYVLLASRRRWAAYMATGFAAQFAASVLAGLHWRMNLLLTALNLTEVLIAALLLRQRSTAPPRFTDQPYLIRFVCFGILAGPLATGLMVALLQALWPRIGLGSTPLEWIAADCLGIGIATPVCVAILRGDFRNTHNFGKHWIYLPLLVAVTLPAFSQSSVPLLFIVYPLLVLILLQMGMGWAAISTLFVAVAGSWCMIHGQGPFAQSHSLTLIEPSVLLQVFIGSGVLLLYSISVVLEREQEIVRQLDRFAALNALVSENSRDAIILADLSGHRSYVSSAAENLGWKPEELLTQDDVEMIHPEDQQRAQVIIRELNSGSEGAMIECRVRNRTGEYIWVEASLRVVRDPETGLPSGILNVVRDVSERKKAEQRLQEAYNAVEAMAVTDALTGLANRRRFDQYLTTEWRRSMRDRQPLSLLMLDVDKFKVYNDTYGHQRGDSCLKQIAEACMDVVSRPGDLVARFGGEEFVVVLPNTESEGALCVANEICESLRSRGLPHSGNQPGIVTVSAGCATLVPRFGKHAPELIEMADQALYRAKNDGRNQVCNGNTIETCGENAQTSALPEAVAGKMA